jgi:cytochrome c oxidase subunit 2
MKSWIALGGAIATALFAVTGVATGQPAPAPRTIEVTAGDYKFQPEVIEATEGERLVLKARVTDGKKHGLAIKEMDIKAALPKSGDPVAIEVVAGKPGTYTISCSVYCGNGHSRMKGRLVVAARK